MKNQLNARIEPFLCFNDKFKASVNILFFLLFFIPSLSFAQDKKPIGEVITSIGSVKAAEADKTERSLKGAMPFMS